MVLGAAVMGVLLIFAAAAVDVGSWYTTAGRIQRATDSAALAGVAELVRTRSAGATEAQAQDAATTIAKEILRDNGFDPSLAKHRVGVEFSKTSTGGDKVRVTLKQDDLPLFFAKMLTNRVAVARASEAVMSDCQASCNTTIPLTSGLKGFVQAGTGGDGFLPALAGDKAFNLFHHTSGKVLVCTDTVLMATCPGFPKEPYAGIVTNYVPTLLGVNERVYFVVQTATSVGLGCWDAQTLAACSGFSTPLRLATYGPNGEKNAQTRIVGPERVDDRLFLYGDDNRIYCYDLVAAAACTGYPKNSGLAASRNFTQDTAGTYVNGVKTNGVQADIQADGNGRVYTVGSPIGGASWLSCWDATTDAACTGWANPSTAAGRVFLFVSYDLSGNPNGVCARGGKGASGTGFECFDARGVSRGTAGVTLTFDGASGEQDAMVVTTTGHTRTYFPQRGSDRADCWDWTLGGRCAIAPSNWSSSNTADYGYVWDGFKCVYGLGHTGLMWAFDVDTGQYPCEGGRTGSALIRPCTCANGTNRKWTRLRITDDTDLSMFTSFTVKITRSDGSVLLTTDLVATGDLEIDLSFLNSLSPPPDSLRVAIETEIKDGYDSAVFANGRSPGLFVVGGRRPTLVQ